MEFDVCEHRIRQVVIRAGQVIRQVKGLPEEKSVTILFNEAAPLLGIAPVMISSRMTDHLPSPAEMKNKDGTFRFPRRDCLHCGTKEMVTLAPLCQGCEDAEGGKYKSIWTCLQCGWKERLEKPFIEVVSDVWRKQGLSEDEILDRLPMGHKKALGIKTMTDKGLQ